MGYPQKFANVNIRVSEEREMGRQLELPMENLGFLFYWTVTTLQFQHSAFQDQLQTFVFDYYKLQEANRENNQTTSNIPNKKSTAKQGRRHRVHRE